MEETGKYPWSDVTALFKEPEPEPEPVIIDREIADGYDQTRQPPKKCLVMKALNQVFSVVGAFAGLRLRVGSAILNFF